MEKLEIIRTEKSWTILRKFRTRINFFFLNNKCLMELDDRFIGNFIDRYIFCRIYWSWSYWSDEEDEIVDFE